MTSSPITPAGRRVEVQVILEFATKLRRMVWEQARDDHHDLPVHTAYVEYLEVITDAEERLRLRLSTTYEGRKR